MFNVQSIKPTFDHNITTYHQQYHHNMTPDMEDQIKLEALFVGDLSYFCTDADLSKLFESYGPIHKAVVRKSKTNEPLHYGFVEIPIENAEKAINNLNGMSYLGRKLR
jgi:RNA recognition motif-containing protein